MGVLKPGVTDRTRVRIMTVDAANRRVEGMLKDGSMIQIALWDDAGNAFRLPIETEIWMVHRQDGIWRLDRRVQQGQVSGIGTAVQVQAEAAPITGMSPGQLRLDSASIIDANGKTAATYAGTPRSNQGLVWTATGWVPTQVLQAANNLSDLTNVTTALQNLGLPDATGKAPFLQLLAVGDVRIAYSGATITWPGGSRLTNNVGITTGLGGFASSVSLTSTNPNATCAFTGNSSNQIFVQGNTVDGTSPAAGTALNVFWIALG